MRTMRVAVYILVGMLIGTIITVSGFGQEDIIFRFGSSADGINTLDPGLCIQHDNRTLVNTIFEQLAYYNLEDMQAPLVPGVATSWEVSEDGLEVTYFLREGVVFQKGYGEMTADDVVFSLDRARDFDTSARASYFTAIDEVRAIDRYTVSIRLSTPDPLLSRRLAVYVVIMSKNAVEDIGPENVATTPIGSGPYQLKEWNVGESVILEAFDEYWGGEPALDLIEFLLIPNFATRELAFVEGSLDAIDGKTDGVWIDRMEALGNEVDVMGPSAFYPIIFNTNIAPFDNILVRKAIAYALDSQAICDFVGLESAVPGMVPIPDSVTGAATIEELDPPGYYFEFNLDKARELLAEAGYPNGFEFETIISDSQTFFDRMVIVQEQLKQIGITMDLQTVAHSSWTGQLRTGNFPFTIYGSMRFDAKMLEGFYHSRSGPGPTAAYNFGAYSNPAVDLLLDTAASQSTVEAAAIYWKAAEQIIMKDLPVYPLLVSKYCVLARKPHVSINTATGGEPDISTFAGYNLRDITLDQ